MTSPNHPRFPHIFKPYSLNGLELRNRIAISGHFAGWWVGPGGLPSDAFAAYIEERAKGGVGLFTIGATSPEPGSGWMQNLDDPIIPRYKLLTDAAHRHGTKLFAQLCHPGFQPLPGIPIIERPPEKAPTTPSSQRDMYSPSRYAPGASAAGNRSRGRNGGIDISVLPHGRAARRLRVSKLMATP